MLFARDRLSRGASEPIKSGVSLAMSRGYKTANLRFIGTFMDKMSINLPINVSKSTKFGVFYPLDITKDTPLLIGSDAPRDNPVRSASRENGGWRTRKIINK